MSDQIIGLSPLGRVALAGLKAYAGWSALRSAVGTLQGDGLLASPIPLGAAPPRLQLHAVDSVHDRIRWIRKQVRKGHLDARVHEAALRVLGRKCGTRSDGRTEWCVAEKDYDGEVAAVFYAVRDNVRYVRDIFHVDTFQHPARTLEWSGGDCDDSVIVLASLLLSVGYPVWGRVIRTRDAEDWNHVFLVVGLPPEQPDRWVGLDASVDRPAGWSPPASLVAEKLDFDLP